jgi:hypothetical protein
MTKELDCFVRFAPRNDGDRPGMSRLPRHTEKALEYRGIGFQGGTRRVVNDRAALQYHNTVGEP